ncbi:hypothetical protein QYF61_010875 [Mycteria americana]|uniref:Uncharacterized protein n=1 Tax=Mycteria americana TaxID=33587 RepID=A0AAN7NHF3_MYCAM|nr:hypothetical protein QYF61_010875 [Mycteria americana]
MLRTHDTSMSQESQRGSLSHENTISREVSPGKRRSRSIDSHHRYMKDKCQSRYQEGSAFYSQTMVEDAYETSCRRRTLSNAQYSRQATSPEYSIQSFTEMIDLHSWRGLYERHYCYYESYRSRSQSSNRSRTRSGIKDSTILEKGNDHKKTLSKFSDCYKNEDSLSDNQASSVTKKNGTLRHHKKKKEKHKNKNKHQKDHPSNLAHSFPVVITIDSDSDMELESIEFDSSITWTGTSQINEKENESPSSFLE